MERLAIDSLDISARRKPNEIDRQERSLQSLFDRTNALLRVISFALGVVFHRQNRRRL